MDSSQNAATACCRGRGQRSTNTSIHSDSSKDDRNLPNPSDTEFEQFDDSSDAEDNHANPSLMIGKVFPTVSPYLDNKTHLSCRQVSGTWRYMVDSYLGKRPRNLPTKYWFLASFKDGIYFTSFAQLRKYHNAVQVSPKTTKASVTGKSFKFAKMVTRHCDPDSYFYWPETIQLLALVGHEVSKCTLVLDEPSHDNYRVLFMCLEYLPNLQQLTLCCVRKLRESESDEEREAIKNGLLDRYLNPLPHLEAISLQFGLTSKSSRPQLEEDSDTTSMFKRLMLDVTSTTILWNRLLFRYEAHLKIIEVDEIGWVLVKKSFPKLEQLKLKDTTIIDIENFMALQGEEDPLPPLTMIGLVLENDKLDVKECVDILNLFESMLTELHLNFEWPVTKNLEMFAELTLPKLSKLKLTDCQTVSFDFILALAPTLKTLQMKNCCADKKGKLGITGEGRCVCSLECFWSLLPMLETFRVETGLGRWTLRTCTRTNHNECKDRGDGRVECTQRSKLF